MRTILLASLTVLSTAVGFSAETNWVSVDNNGRFIASVNGSNVHVWTAPRKSLSDIRPASKLECSGEVASVEFSSDGRFLGACGKSSEDQNGEIVLWRTTDWNPKARVHLPSIAQSLTFFRGNMVLAACDDGMVYGHVIQDSELKLLFKLVVAKQRATSVASSGSYICAGAAPRVRVWHFQSHENIELKRTIKLRANQISTISAHSSREQFAISTRDLKARVVHFTDEKKDAGLPFPGYDSPFQDAIDSVSISRDGMLMATGHQNGMIRLYAWIDDHWKRKPTRQFREYGRVRCLTFLSSKYLVSGSDDGDVTVRTLDVGKTETLRLRNPSSDRPLTADGRVSGQDLLGDPSTQGRVLRDQLDLPEGTDEFVAASLETLYKGTDNPGPIVRLLAELEEPLDQGDVRALAVSLHVDRLDLRKGAAMILAKSKSKHLSLAIPSLVDALDDADPLVRKGAELALARQGSAAAKALVDKYLPSKGTTRLKVRRLLTRMSADTVSPLLIKSLSAPTAWAKSLPVFKSFGEDGISHLIHGINNDELQESTRLGVVWLLGQMPYSPRVITALERTSQDQSERIRRALQDAIAEQRRKIPKKE
ncbi:hypothetical protein [Symmachiella dynata]|uniref:hypothetical protein n=1 Tax=Symmachiella dynata TaxID=2527995 RepID=UPI0030ED7AE1